MGDYADLLRMALRITLGLADGIRGMVLPALW